jgi:hypothetical protein
VSSGTNNCFSSLPNEREEQFFANDVNLNALAGGNSKLEIQIKGIKTHRFVGPSCHLSITLTTKTTTYFNSTFCVLNLETNIWKKNFLESTSLVVARKGQSLKLIFGSDLEIVESDTILLNFPTEILSSSIPFTRQW